MICITMISSKSRIFYIKWNIQISLGVSQEECLKNWHAFWYVCMPIWEISTPFGALARQVKMLARRMARWHVKIRKLAPFWYVRSQAHSHVNHAGTQARWHVNHTGTQASWNVDQVRTHGTRLNKFVYMQYNISDSHRHKNE